jgi:hypothetical protein
MQPAAAHGAAHNGPPPPGSVKKFTPGGFERRLSAQRALRDRHREDVLDAARASHGDDDDDDEDGERCCAAAEPQHAAAAPTAAEVDAAMAALCGRGDTVARVAAMQAVKNALASAAPSSAAADVFLAAGAVRPLLCIAEGTDAPDGGAHDVCLALRCAAQVVADSSLDSARRDGAALLCNAVFSLCAATESAAVCAAGIAALRVLLEHCWAAALLLAEPRTLPFLAALCGSPARRCDCMRLCDALCRLCPAAPNVAEVLPLVAMGVAEAAGDARFYAATALLSLAHSHRGEVAAALPADHVVALALQGADADAAHVALQLLDTFPLIVAAHLAADAVVEGLRRHLDDAPSLRVGVLRVLRHAPAPAQLHALLASSVVPLLRCNEGPTRVAVLGLLLGYVRGGCVALVERLCEEGDVVELMSSSAMTPDEMALVEQLLVEMVPELADDDAHFF